MVPTAEELLKQALELPEEARAELAAALVESVDGPHDAPEAVEASWRDEIGRRIRELETDTIKPIPWEEARRLIFGDDSTRR